MQSNCNKFVSDANIFKIAVQFKNYPAQLIEFDQQQSLDEIIRELCKFPEWQCDSQSDTYALQFFEANCKKYVDETNRIHVKNGSVLLLTRSALKFVTDIVEKLKTALPGDKLHSLKILHCMAKDFVFATEFLNMNGIDLLIEYINNEKCTGDTLKYVLLSLTELMGHGIVSWKSVESSIIGKIIYFLDHEHTIIEFILDVLDNLIQNSLNPESIDIKFDSLLLILERSSCDELVKQKMFCLINSLFQATGEGQKTQIAIAFRTKKYRDVINSSVVKMETMSNELNYQLYVFQTLVLNRFEKRMMTPISECDDIVNKIQIFKLIAFNENGDGLSKTDSMKRPGKLQKICHKLGFKSEFNIIQSFSNTPPGVLPLDCLEYFTQNHSKLYKTIIAELNATSDEYGFLLGEAAIELVKLLCDLFKIGKPPSAQGGTYYPIFFAHEHPFYELFCICIEVLHRNWKEMKASSHDFKTVFSVAKEQIVRTLNTRPLNLNDFKRNINTFTYSKIIWFRELERAAREEYESSVSSIVALKKKLTPHVIDIIKKQRLDYLVNGSRFNQYSKSGLRIKNKYWYARLSTNHKILHYGDCGENDIPTVEDLDKQIHVNDIKQLLIGKDCSNLMKRRGLVLKCLFAIVYLDWKTLQPCEPLEFIATDELTQNYWVDGLNALLKLDMASMSTNEDLDTLLPMEIKIRLLDTENIDLDKDAPPIPPDPEDYDF